MTSMVVTYMTHLTVEADCNSSDRKVLISFAILSVIPSSLIVLIELRSEFISDRRDCVASFHSLCRILMLRVTVLLIREHTGVFFN